jgi:hypothetical protein
MLTLTDLQGDNWTGWTFRNKKELKDFLISQSISTSGYTDKEYKKENADVSLDEYCEMFQIEYKENEHEE